MVKIQLLSQHVCGFEDTIMKPERTKSVPAFMFSKNKHIKGEHMEFYQLKNYKKRNKNLRYGDAVWYRQTQTLRNLLQCWKTFWNMQTLRTMNLNFSRKKLRLQNLEAQTAEATKGSYEYAEAKGRQIAELLDTEAWFTFRVKGMELPEYRTDIEKKINR